METKITEGPYLLGKFITYDFESRFFKRITLKIDINNQDCVLKEVEFFTNAYLEEQSRIRSKNFDAKASEERKKMQGL